MSFDKSKLVSKKAIAVYVALAVVIASAFGYEGVACKLSSLLDVQVEMCVADVVND